LVQKNFSLAMASLVIPSAFTGNSN